MPPLAAPAAATPAPDTAAYQAAVVPGSGSANSGYFRINISTGQVVSAWGNSSTATPIADTPLPPGQYHIYPYSQPAAADGSVSWGMMRVDLVSGRMRFLNGGGNNNPFVWVEITAPR